MKQGMLKEALTVETDSEETHDILEDVVHATEQTFKVNGIVVGGLKAFDEADRPMVDFSINPMPDPLPARSTVALSKDHIGRDVALLFEQNDVRKPIVIGLMHVIAPTVEVSSDAMKREITAKEELVLRCGDSSILLRKDGKIVIKGRDILSRARRNNKVKGGSVQLN